jgi:hypothetical protein
MGRERAQTVIIHGLEEGDHHMVADDGIMEVVLVMGHGVHMVLGARMEVQIMGRVAVVKIMVHGVPMGVVEDPMGVKWGIMEVGDLIAVVEDTTVVVEPKGVVEVGVVAGMELVAHHQVGKIQEEEEEVGTGVGHLWSGMETRKSVSTAMVLLRRLVTKKVSSQEIYFIVTDQYLPPSPTC